MRKLITTIALACAAFAANGQREDITVTSVNLMSPSTLVLSSTLDDAQLTVTGTISSMTGMGAVTLTDQILSNDDVNFTVPPQSLGSVNSSFRFKVGANGVFVVTVTSKRSAIISSNAEITVSGYVPLTGVTITGANGTISQILGKATVSFAFAPANATKPNISISTPSDRILKADGIVAGATTFDLNAKNNGIAVVTLTAANLGSSFSSTVTYTVTGHNGYRETFIGTKNDSYNNPTTYNTRTNTVGPFKDFKGTNPLTIWWSNPAPWAGGPGSLYSLTSQLSPTTSLLGTTDALFITPSQPNLEYPTSPGRFFNGFNEKVYIFLNGFDINADGAGIKVNQNQPTLVEIENLSSTPMETQITIHDEDDLPAGGSVGGLDNKYGTPTLVTIPGMTRQVVTIPTPETRNYVDAVGFRTRFFNGNFAIRSVNVGYNVPTMFTLNSVGTLERTFASTITVTSGGFEANVINEVAKWEVMNPANAPNFVIIASNTKNSAILQYDSDVTSISGVSTLMGTLFGSTVTSKVLVPFGLPISFTLTTTSVMINGTTVPITLTSRNFVPSVANFSSITYSAMPAANVSISGMKVYGKINGPVTLTGMFTNYLGQEVKSMIVVTVSGVTSAEEASALASTLVVSPNPTSDVVSVSSSAAIVGLKVYSTTGTLVAVSTSSSVSLGGLSSGLYILEVSTANGVVRKTVVKN